MFYISIGHDSIIKNNINKLRVIIKLNVQGYVD